MRLVWLFISLVILVLVPFFIWGDTLTSLFSADGAVVWLQQYGYWAWAVGLVLILSDLLLPVPATLVMAALGFIYGWAGGGAISALGSFMAGGLGYELCRSLGSKAAHWILGAKDLQKAQRLNRRVGGWLVALSRWLPVFPEVISCMAGLTRMPRPLFYGALACGSLPLGFTYATIGYAGQESPTIALVLSALLPPLLWLLIRPYFHRKVSSVS